MIIYLLERDYQRAVALKKAFNGTAVEVVHDDFVSFMSSHTVECVVSPANSYGHMSGGYDWAITEWFGVQLQKRVQAYIAEYFYGEQPIGTSFIIDAGEKEQKLIHTPTMRYPSPIRDPMIVYQAMRTTLIVALENKIKSIVIPMFGGLTGNVAPDLAARLMREGYDQIINYEI